MTHLWLSKIRHFPTTKIHAPVHCVVGVFKINFQLAKFIWGKNALKRKEKNRAFTDKRFTEIE